MQIDKAHIQAQARGIDRIVNKAYLDLCAGAITSQKFDSIMDNCERENGRIREANQLRLKAMSYSGCADSAQAAQYPVNPGAPVWLKDAKFKGLLDEHGKNPFAPSPLHASQEQWGQLFDAAEHQLPSFAVNLKAYDGDASQFRGRVKQKAPNFTTEGAPSSLLPPQLIPSAFPLLYEPTRIWSHLPGMPMDSQSIEFLQHTANTIPAALTAEVAALPDLGMTYTPKTAVAQKIGDTAAFSRELLDDFGDFMGAVPVEMVKALVDAESNFVLNNATYGLLAANGILTRSATSSATAIDAVLAGINDIRIASASFAEADLVIMHPTTWLDLRTTRTTTGAYVLDQWKPMETLGENLNTFFGVPVVQTTTCPVSTAVVMNREDAVIAFTRMGVEMAVNWMGDSVFSTFAYQWRVVERIALDD